MRLFVVFVLVKFSRKKKLKKFEITPDNLIHYTTFFPLILILDEKKSIFFL